MSLFKIQSGSIYKFAILYLLLLSSSLFLLDFVVEVEKVAVSFFICHLVLGICLLVQSNPFKFLLPLVSLSISGAISLIIAEFIFFYIAFVNYVPRDIEEFIQRTSIYDKSTQKIPKDKGTYRILGLADSYGVYGVENNYHFLLRKMSYPKKVEITNFSIPAIGIQDQLLLFERFASKYNPNMILHSFFVGNDFTDLANGNNYWNSYLPHIPFAKRKMFLPRYFFLKRYLIGLLNFLAKKPTLDGGTFSVDMFLLIGFNASQICNKELPISAVKEQLDALHKVYLNAKKMNIPYLLVIHPDQYQVEEKLRLQLKKRYAIDWSAYNLKRPQQILIEFCQSRKIPYLDLLEVFQGSNVKDSFYELRDTHYNTKGNRLAAKEIHKFLKEKIFRDE